MSATTHTTTPISLLRCCLLIRVSTTKQDFERQKMELSALAINQGFYFEDDDIYSEKVSAVKQDVDRVGLNRLRKDIKEGKKQFSRIYVLEISRLSRDAIFGRAIADEFTLQGIPLYVASINLLTIDINGRRDPMANVAFQLFLEYAQIDAATLKARMSSGKRMAAINGKFTGGRSAYGFKLVVNPADEKGRHMMVINNVESGVVVKMYEMCISGIGVMLITKYLNQNVIPSRGGKPWNMNSVMDILANKTNYGTRQYADIIGTDYPAIISKNIYDDAQAKIKSRYHNKGKVKYTWLLKNKLVCGACGATYTPKYNNRNEAYYMCYSKAQYKSSCESKAILVESLDGVIWYVVQQNLELMNFLKNTNEELTKTQEDIKALSIQSEILENELMMKKKKRKNKLEQQSEGLISMQELKDDLKQIDININTINHKLLDLINEIDTKKRWEKNFDTKTEYLKTVKNIGESKSKIAEVFGHIIDKVSVESVGKVSNRFYKIKINLMGNKNPITGNYYSKNKMWFIDSANNLQDLVAQNDLQLNFKNYDLQLQEHQVLKYSIDDVFIPSPGDVVITKKIPVKTVSLELNKGVIISPVIFDFENIHPDASPQLQ